MTPSATFSAMPRASTLAKWVLASMLAHALMMTLLPGWRADTQTPPTPLQVELREPPPPPEVTPPKPLPVQARPTPVPPKPEPKKARLPQPETPAPAPPHEQRAPVLTAPPEATPAPQAPVVAEQRPVPSPTEPVRAPAPPPAPPPPAPVIAPVFDAAYLHNPKPAYPEVARRRGETGTVYVYVQVDKDGKPLRVNLHKSSGSSSLDEAALRSIKSWRFAPARKGTEPVEGEVIVPMPFTLIDSGR